MSNEAKAKAMLARVRSLPGTDVLLAVHANALGLKFFEDDPPLVQAHPSRSGDGLGPPLTLEQCKARHVALVLREAPSMSEAARMLAIDRRTLYQLCDRYEIKRLQRPRKGFKR